MFQKWAINNNVKICMESMIVFLQINGLINEEKAIEFLKDSEKGE